MITPGSFRIVARSVTPTPNANGSFSTYLASGLLNHAFVSSMSFSPPPAVYVALYTAPPTAAGGGTEVSGDPSYSRLAIIFSPAAGSPATIENNVQLMWPVATVDWGFVSAAGLLDAATGGNLLAYGLMLAPDGITVTPKLVTAGDVFVIPVGTFVIGLA